MDVGIVLPNSARGIDGDTLLEHARLAEACGFARVGVIGRTVYPAYEELVTLAAVAGATQRVKLLTTVLIAPTREPVTFAKQTASLDRLSNGRLVLGLGVGMRDDDFTATGTIFTDRGKRFDAMLEQTHRLWDEGTVAPRPVNGRVPIYFGTLSASPKIAARMARWGDGYIAVGSPEMVQPVIDELQRAWDEAGRDGKPKLMAATYFSLGNTDEAAANITAYYDNFFPVLGELAVNAMARTPDHIKHAIDVFEQAGFDEFNFSCAAADPSQIERLAAVIG